MIKDWLARLEADAHFKKYKNADRILTHIFFIKEQSGINNAQIGYYDKKKDLLTTFQIEDKSITAMPEAEAFKKENDVLKELDMSKVKIDYEKADSITQEVQEDKYPAELPIKKIFILQHLDLGQVWNITFVTRNFKTLNIKVDASTGEVVSDKLVPIISFG